MKQFTFAATALFCFNVFMVYKIAFASQSGNAGKTALATALAVDALNNKLPAKLIDLDVEHQSAMQWAEQRAAMKLKPLPAVRSVTSATDALQDPVEEGLLIIDCPSRATAATMTIASQVNLVVMPVAPGKKDADLQLAAIKRLNDHGVPINRCLLVLSRQSSESETRRMRHYIQGAVVNGLSVRLLGPTLPERASYRASVQDGFALQETPYKSLNKTAQRLLHQLVEEIVQ